MALSPNGVNDQKTQLLNRYVKYIRVPLKNHPLFQICVINRKVHIQNRASDGFIASKMIKLMNEVEKEAIRIEALIKKDKAIFPNRNVTYMVYGFGAIDSKEWYLKEPTQTVEALKRGKTRIHDANTKNNKAIRNK